jgi:cellobiose-specific phosphotransferase system component IIC
MGCRFREKAVGCLKEFLTLCLAAIIAIGSMAVMIPVIVLSPSIAILALAEVARIEPFTYSPSYLTFALAASVILTVVVGRLALRYRRSRLGWMVLSLTFGPIVTLIFLWIADVPHRAVVAEGKAAEILRRREGHPDWPDARRIAGTDARCPKCDALVNPETGEGVEASPEEPWRLLCIRCRAEVQRTG